MKKWLFLFFILITEILTAQDSTINILKMEAFRPIPISISDTIKKNWIRGGIFNLNIAQGALKNWAAGGDDFSMSMNMYANGHAFYKKGKESWDNNVDIHVGYINTTSLGTRKNDDRFDFLSKYGYALNSKISASALFGMRTQFFDGFTYTNPDFPIFSSTAFSPAYILVSPGFDYKPVKNLSIFISPISSRWVIVANPTLSKIGSYGVDSGKKSITQLGAFGTVTLNTNFIKNITYNARIDLFSNYEHNPFNIDVYMTNLFAAKFSKWFSVTWNVDMIYDDDVRLFGPDHNSPRLQIKSLIGIGVLVKLGM
ncbi:MAG: DUF3078 domain-containing protein [Parafilimonas sp.]